jgi:hypothetical protein
MNKKEKKLFPTTLQLTVSSLFWSGFLLRWELCITALTKTRFEINPCSDINEITKKKVSIVFFVHAPFFFRFLVFSRSSSCNHTFPLLCAIEMKPRLIFAKVFEQKVARDGLRESTQHPLHLPTSFSASHLCFPQWQKREGWLRGWRWKSGEESENQYFHRTVSKKARREENDPLSDVSLCSTIFPVRRQEQWGEIYSKSDAIRNGNSCLCSLTKNGQNFLLFPPRFSLFSRNAPHTFISFPFK